MARSLPAGLAQQSLQAAVENRGLRAIRRCYQCRKCTNGCPLTFAMDLLPHQVVRAVQLGLDEEVLGSKTIWVCAACQTCSTRCPNDIDIAHLMDLLRQESQGRAIPPGEPEVVLFHRAFLGSVRRHGRVFELGMLVRYKLAALWAALQKGGHRLKLLPGQLWQEAQLGWAMFRRGRLRLWPNRIRSPEHLRRMGSPAGSRLGFGQSNAGPNTSSMPKTNTGSNMYTGPNTNAGSNPSPGPNIAAGSNISASSNIHAESNTAAGPIGPSAVAPPLDHRTADPHGQTGGCQR
jgi:heterodisulfide reductase subunit C